MRPVRWYDGTPSPVKGSPSDVDMIIFEENSEDVYAGIEWEGGSAEVAKVMDFLVNEMRLTKSDSQILPELELSQSAKKALLLVMRAAIQYAVDNDKDSVTLVHKGNIMKFTEGGFREIGVPVGQR